MTSAAIVVGRRDASNAVIGPTPDRPASSAAQVLSRSSPSGVTAPMPVITTLSAIDDASHQWIFGCHLSVGPGDCPGNSDGGNHQFLGGCLS